MKQNLTGLIFLIIFSFPLTGFAEPSYQIPQILDESALKNVDPCTDFYQFACGSWIERTQIPQDKDSVSRTSTQFADQIDAQLNQILQAYAQDHNTPPATYSQKLADFYSSCMSQEQNQNISLNFVKDYIFKIQQTVKADDLAQLIASMHADGLDAFFGFGAMQDPHNSSQVIADLAQGGLSLYERDYYLSRAKNFVQTRKKYLEYISGLFKLIGYTPQQATSAANQILKLEISLARKSLSSIEQNDPNNTTHPSKFADLVKLSPNFSWEFYFAAQNISISTLNIDAPGFIANFDLILKSTKKTTRDLYLTWKFLDFASGKMGGDFNKLHFAFWGTHMNGLKTQKPQWQICTQATKRYLSEALAEAYVKTFDGEALKKIAAQMIDEIKEAFVTNLYELTTGENAWLDNSTLQEALKKVSKIGQKIGAPEKFKNYDALNLQSENFLQNIFSVAKFEHANDLKEIGHPADRSKWSMMAWEINAYYDIANNEFVFPFAILFPPTLDPKASTGANFGPFGGGTIGHELTHGFDSYGSQYDSDGNLKNWWSEQTAKQFKNKAQCFIDQANKYVIKDVNMKVNGELTIDENLADQGGLKLGYKALDKLLANKPVSSPWLGKYNEKQQYWIAYAQSWCSKSRPESLRYLMTNDSHPPDEFRVNAVLMNRPEFAKDFNCPLGSTMAPRQRCQLW